MASYNGQAEQDKFVLNVLKNKTNGFFVEIGSNHPVTINNSFILENKFNWTGIMVEYNKSWLNSYKQHRPKSTHVINNAVLVDYKKLLEETNAPLNIDYLQIDLEANNGSTLRTLEKLNNEVMDKYKFATITFEHDAYHTNYMNTRTRSREIFESRGYVRVFDDINNQGANPYEDWYVHPDLVDMDYVNNLIEKNKNKYVTGKWSKCKDNITKSLNWQDIIY